MELCFYFLAGHAVGDFVLQHDTMAVFKSRHYRSPDGLESKPSFPAWYYWLSAHALVHGAIVSVISGSWILGLVETLLHWITDYAKCESWLSFHQDQAIHLLCKLGYVALLLYFPQFT